MTLVTIRPISKSMNFGVDDKKTGKKKSKYDTCFDKWIPGLDGKTGVLNTGLSFEEEKYFEKECNLPEGALKRNSSYWDTFFIIISSEGKSLDTSLPEHKLWYKLFQADPNVVTVSQNGAIPFNAEYTMTTENEKAAITNKKRDVLAKCMTIYGKLTADDINKILTRFGKNSKDLDLEIAKSRIGDLIDENPEKFLKLVGDENFNFKVWVINLIKEGHLNKNGVGKGYDMPIYYQDVLLGTGLDEVTTFLSSKENNSIYISLKKLSA